MVPDMRKLWRYMKNFENDVFTTTNEEGIDRVRKDRYGFVLPDTIGEYIVGKEPCDLVTVGKFLMNRGYGIALQKESPLLEELNETITKLRETGFLKVLKDKWWVAMSPCHGRQGSRAVRVGGTTPIVADRHLVVSLLTIALLLLYTFTNVC